MVCPHNYCNSDCEKYSWHFLKYFRAVSYKATHMKNYLVCSSPWDRFLDFFLHWKTSDF